METLQSILEESKVKGYFSISQASTFTERCLSLNDSYDEDSSMERKDAFELAKKIVLAESQSSGTIGDYYNYAGTFAKSDEYYWACEVLLCGLNKYSQNNDLLAYYLICATNSSSIEHYKKCDNVYKTLQSLRPSRWNWRAYDFSISYLLDKINRGVGGEPENIKSECLDLAYEYQKRIPTNERAYLAESNIYSAFEEPEKEINALEKAMKKNGLRIVGVAFSLAEMYIERNKPKKALECVQRVLVDFAEINSRTTPARIYILSIISKTPLLMSAGTDVVKLAQEIHDDWTKIQKLKGIDNEQLNSVKMLVKLAEVNSGIEFNDDEDI
jgi:hypothetical protein